jgi:C4-dicarboxylate-specific signal transduction histidine kinase
VQRIDSIVRSLLELGRPSRGKAQPVDARTTIDSAVRLLGAGRDFSHVKTVIDAPESLWLRAETGPLSQVLINLLINAAQLMTAGTITVRARVEGERGLITVEDEGPGFTPEVQARLFEPVFTTRPPGQGTGLGLAISRHLLAQFEGTLTAANREAPARGACFTISLPVP